MAQRRDFEHGIALDAAKQDIAMRIRRVCQHFAEAEFRRLVDHMAEIEVRYRLRDDWAFYREATRASMT